MVIEQQCNFLSEAFQEQSMVLPFRAPTSAAAPAPVPPAGVLDLPEGWEFAAESRVRERLAHANSALNAT
jgi:hypothetical protein